MPPRVLTLSFDCPVVPVSERVSIAAPLNTPPTSSIDPEPGPINFTFTCVPSASWNIVA